MFDIDNMGLDYDYSKHCYSGYRVIYRFIRRKINKKVATMKYTIYMILIKLNGGI